jgi:hypothetical protein
MIRIKLILTPGSTATLRVFSLLLNTVKFSDLRLFFHPSKPTPGPPGPDLRKSHFGSGWPAYTRSENAVKALQLTGPLYIVSFKI